MTQCVTGWLVNYRLPRWALPPVAATGETVIVIHRQSENTENCYQMGTCFTVPIMFSQQSFVEIKEHVKKSKCLNLRPLDVSDLTCVVPELVFICPICLEIVGFLLFLPAGTWPVTFASKQIIR